jgi:hypothetical protein
MRIKEGRILVQLVLVCMVALLLPNIGLASSGSPSALDALKANEMTE